MAKQVSVGEGKPGVFSRLNTFLREVWVELEKVTWPTRDDLKVSTKVTMYLLIIMAVVAFSFDWIFSRAILILLGLAN